MFARNVLRTNARSFVQISQRNKSTIEKAKEFGHEINKKTGEVLGKGMETAEKATMKTAEELKGGHPAEAIKAGIDKANLSAGKGLAKGIEYAESAAEKTKEAVGLGTKKAEQAAEDVKKMSYETTEQAKQMGYKAAEQAKQKGEETLNSAADVAKDVDKKARKTIDEAKRKL